MSSKDILDYVANEVIKHLDQQNEELQVLRAFYKNYSCAGGCGLLTADHGDFDPLTHCKCINCDRSVCFGNGCYNYKKGLCKQCDNKNL